MATVKDTLQTTTPTGTVERWDSSRIMTEVARWLTEPGYVIPWPDQDPTEAASDINRQILEMDDPFAPTSESGALSTEAAAGLSFELRSVGFRPSDESSGAAKGGAFSIIEGVTADGEKVVIVTGSEKIMAKCIAAIRTKKLGSWVKVTRSEGKTRSGRYFYDLVAGDDQPFAS